MSEGLVSATLLNVERETGDRLREENAALRFKLAGAEARANQFQRERAELFDRLNGTPCAEIRWQQERDNLAASVALLREALEIIAGRRQCIDNLMGNADIAEWALKHTQPSDYRERVRREAFEAAAKVAEHTTAYDDNLQKSVGANTTGQCIASTIRALGDSNANG